MRERELGQSSGEGPSTPPTSGRTEPTMDLHFGTEMREDVEDVEEMEERCSYTESPAPPLPGTIVSPRGFDMNQIPSADEMEEEEEAIDSSTRRSGTGGGDSGREEEEKWPAAKKKLRLTGEQSLVLEESFKQRSTLNSKEKLDLAEQLKLHPRQVEVWFQNRRARTKMKQTEEECEYMKRCCETLRAENRRLLKELAALSALETCSTRASSICPSCRRAAAAALFSKPSSYSFAFDTTAEQQQHLPPDN